MKPIRTGVLGLVAAVSSTLAAGGQGATAPAPAGAPAAAEVPSALAAPASSGNEPLLTAEELDHRLRVLERASELAAEATAEKAKTASTATASASDGFSIRSADGAFVLRIRGYLQADTRFFPDDERDRAVDTFTLRRVRPILEGTLWRRFDFRIMPDFGGGQSTLYDAYLEARLSPAFRVRAGKFKPPIGLERLASGTDLLFVERGLPTSLAPNRDVGLQLSGEPARGRVSYAIGVFNGVADGAQGDNDTNDRKEVAGRIFFQPWKEIPGLVQGLGFGVAASSGDSAGTLAAPGVAGYRTPGQLSAFAYRADGTAAGTVLAAGHRERVAPQLTYAYGPVEVLAEWTRSTQELVRGVVAAELEHEAWQVAAGWILTGEAATLRTPTPAQPFDPAARNWGAVELVARAGRLEVDPRAFPVFANPASAVSQIESAGVGVNWYLNRNLKLQLDYERTAFAGGGTPDRADESILFSRLQITF